VSDIESLKTTGKRLIYFAWAIEIVVALVSFSISISLVVKGQQQVAQVGADGAQNIDFIIIGLSFFVIGIIELTKIPLATALYNAATQNFKVIFFIALIAVNVLTIETIVQGLRTAFSANSLAVDLERQELKNLEDQLANIETQKIDKDSITSDILNQIEILEKNVELQKDQISRYKSDAIREKDDLRKELSEANPKAQSLQTQIEDAKKKIDELESKKTKISEDSKIKQYIQQIDREQKNINGLRSDEKVLFAEKADLAGKPFKGSAKKAIDQKLEAISKTILTKENEITRLDKNITNRQNELEKNFNENIETTEKLILNLQNKYDETLGLSKQKIEPKEKSIDQRRDKDIERSNEKIKGYNQDIEELKKKLPDNQNNSGSNSQNGNYLQDKLEITTLIDKKTKEFRDIAGRNQIYSIAKLIKFFPPLYWFSDQKIPDDFGEEDLSARDLERAFWVFGGLLAFIISVIGTLVAFAGLHMQDREAHLKHNKILASKTTFGYRLRRLISNLSRYLQTSISIMLKPKTVEKIVEKEVEVEKIVEKPVVEEKIVYQKVEVPKEVVKKELVHVPLWTQDPDLIGKKIDLTETEIKPKKKK
tara:strand:+ start:344 stop:2131 length:1788 start_codon:yes stop_codon:yes gene_type:complete